MHITNIMTISRITSQRFILHPPFSPFAAVFLVSGFFIPRRAAGKRDTDPGFVNRYNYGGFLRKWIDCGYSVGGDCEKGSGGVANYLGLCLARVREIWKIQWGIVRDFSRSRQTPTEFLERINGLECAARLKTPGVGGWLAYRGINHPENIIFRLQ